MAVQTFKTSPSSPLTKSFEGHTNSRGGAVTPGTYYGETATALFVGHTGAAVSNVVLEGVDGSTVPFTNVQPGTFIAFKHTRVVSAGTTATNMTWMGGED